MGRHHTNPPNPGTHPPNGEHRHKGGPGTASPTHRTRGQQGGTGNQTPPTPAGPTNTGQTTATKKGRRGRMEEPQPLYEPRPTHPPPNHTAGQDTPTHDGPTKGGGGRHNLVVVTAPGKRPATFRTWKLSPAAPMVLHPRGCGRVGNRHNTPPRGAAHTSAAPPHTPTHTRARQTSTRARPHNNAGTQHATTRTRAHARQHAREHATTRTRGHARDHARNTAHTRARTSTHTQRREEHRNTTTRRRAPGRPIAPALLPA